MTLKHKPIIFVKHFPGRAEIQDHPDDGLLLGPGRSLHFAPRKDLQLSRTAAAPSGNFF